MVRKTRSRSASTIGTCACRIRAPQKEHTLRRLEAELAALAVGFSITAPTGVPDDAAPSGADGS